ncbi:MAG: rod shape-determining protein [Clostridia bacterium]|nr:rod shape-determining protein [Clostridia bacterium]
MNGSWYVGVDLGTANTLVYTRDKGITVNEPSVVAYEKSTSEIICVGTAAERMIGKTPAGIGTVYPLRGGVIADFEFCAEMLCEFLKKGAGLFPGVRPRVIICVPYGISEIERRAVLDSATDAGARSVYVFDEPLCAAIGAGLPVLGSKGCMVVDIGAGTTEIAVISHGGIVTSDSFKIAGNTLDNAIISYIKQEFNVLIGEASARDIKEKIGSAHTGSDIGAIEVKGRNMRDGKAAEFVLYSAEVREAITESLDSLFEAVRSVLDSTPPELCADIYDSGIMLTGGGALLGGLDVYLHERTKLPVMVAERASECVIGGIGKLIRDGALREKIEKMVIHASDDAMQFPKIQ